MPPIVSLLNLYWNEVEVVNLLFNANYLDILVSFYPSEFFPFIIHFKNALNIMRERAAVEAHVLKSFFSAISVSAPSRKNHLGWPC